MNQKIAIDVHMGHAVNNKDADDAVCLEFTDKLSGIQFMDISMSLAKFGELIANRGSVRLEATVRGLHNLGKKHISEQRVAHAPDMGYRTTSREQYSQWLLDNCQEEGWNISTYLGSQSSIGFADKDTGLVPLRYHVFKYVEPESV